jgi:hypothetical protein
MEQESAMTDAPSDKSPRDRSPSFPFIPLQSAVERLTAFETTFGRHPVPVEKAGPAWGWKEKSSQADQTLAALRSFGLIEYQKINGRRQVVLTEEARKYLRAQQDTVKKQVLKQSALRPKIVRQFWTSWGPDRPSDPIAIDQLTLENGFSDAGAKNFLRVYDATISFAGLSDSDKVMPPDPVDDAVDEPEDDFEMDNPPPPKPPKGGIALMAGERELTTGLLSKEASFRLIVSGRVGAKEIDRLIQKLSLDKEILAEPDPEA